MSYVDSKIKSFLYHVSGSLSHTVEFRFKLAGRTTFFYGFSAAVSYMQTVKLKITKTNLHKFGGSENIF